MVPRFVHNILSRLTLYFETLYFVNSVRQNKRINNWMESHCIHKINTIVVCLLNLTQQYKQQLLYTIYYNAIVLYYNYCPSVLFFRQYTQTDWMFKFVPFCPSTTMIILVISQWWLTQYARTLVGMLILWKKLLRGSRGRFSKYSGIL